MNRVTAIMNRFFSYFLGPELYWLVTYALVRTAARRHVTPDPAITSWLDDRWPVLPLIVVPLTFLLFLVPGTGRWWLLLRIDLAIAIGLAVATTHWCEAMIYHKPSAGPGAGTGWMVMLLFGYLLMAVGTVIAIPILWWRSRAAG